eukprot:13800838-Alexandrium_andersonii.AAC.1
MKLSPFTPQAMLEPARSDALVQLLISTLLDLQAPMRGAHMSSELGPIPDTPPGPRGGSPNGPCRDESQLLPTGMPSGLG